MMPINDDERVAALHALGLLDTDPETEFDALVALAAELLDCPTALLSLVDRDRLWIKARAGSDLTEVSRDVAFCDHTIRDDAVMVVRDAVADTRFTDNPFVTEQDGVRFYAGAPIHAPDGDHGLHRIGALCVIDQRGHDPSPRQIAALKHLASLADAIIAARLATRQAVALAHASREQEMRLRRQERTFHQAERMAMVGSWRLKLDDESLDWSEGVYRIHEEPIGSDVSLARGLDYYPPAERARVSAAMAATLETGQPFDFDADFITARGSRRRVRASGELELEGGVPVALVGIFQDITEHHRLALSLRESASVDAVTRIANRAAFNEELAARLKQQETSPFALVMIDLDLFKAVNDTHGHLAGDEVLRAVGQRLRAPFLDDAFAARLGGDEFALLIGSQRLLGDLDGMARGLLELLRIPVQTADALLSVSATVGTAVAKPGMSARDLIHAADAALYDAKRERRGTFRLAA